MSPKTSIILTLLGGWLLFRVLKEMRAANRRRVANLRGEQKFGTDHPPPS